MRFQFPEKQLENHPLVYKVDQWKLALTFEFRVSLYKVWKAGQGVAGIASLLKENGLTPKLVGNDYHITLATGFKNSGYPGISATEASLIKDYKDENPLVVSGLFKRCERGNGLVMSERLKRALMAGHPDVSVEEGLRTAGLDLMDVGYQRIKKIKKELEQEQEQIYKRSTMDCMIQESEQEEFGAENNAGLDGHLWEHPYVKEVQYDRVILRDCFYNEAYLLAPQGVNRLLEIYELDPEMFPELVRIAIGSRLYHWKKTDECMEGTNEQVIRIQKSRAAAMNSLIKTNFSAMSVAINKMDTASRRKVCIWASELPRDITGYYNTGTVRELLGISKSTYYALLNNESYGTKKAQKAGRDEEDIKIIKQVRDYKGFEKGIRQIYMLMPLVSGEQMSMYRIRRLMNKYGIRTTIRRPSRNRKVMKELIERNKKANILLRRFKLHRPNEVRLTDVTYLDYGVDKRAYGSACIDPVTSRLICFVVSENNDLRLALDTLKAMDTYPAVNGAILHSDQGILYMTDEFQAAVVERTLTQSMSRRGNCWDNAVQESFFGHFKDECPYSQCKSLEELQESIDKYAFYYNNERGMWDKGRMTPVQYESYLTKMDDEAFAAYLVEEEKKYAGMKERAARKAVEDAREYKTFVEKTMEERK